MSIGAIAGINRGPGRAASPMAVTLVVLIGAFMTVLDSTIANVALPHMQPSLDAAADTVTWVLTSYIVATAIAIPLTGWAAARFGRRRLFLVSVAVFTLASALCGIAQGLAEMVVFRAVQGAAGAFLTPLGQAYILDVWPREKHGQAMAWWGVGIMVGPILGPVIGGWLTDSFDWRWVFLINVPFGIACFLFGAALLPDTPSPARRFDMTGFLLLAVGLAALQLGLDRGHQLDWFDSWEVRSEAVVGAVAIGLFVVHALTTPNAIIDRRMIRDRNAATGFVFITLVGLLMVSTTALVPTMLQTLFGYPVLASGVLQMPRGIGMALSMMTVGQLVNRVDPRLLVGLGLAITAAALWGMSLFSPQQDAPLFVITAFFQGAGLGLVFVPLNTIAFSTLPADLRTDASAMYMLLRNLGGSVGISVGVGVLSRQMQTVHAEVAASMNTEALTGPLAGAATDPVARAMLDAVVSQQAAMVAYIDVFRLLAWVTLAILPLLVLLKPMARAEVVHLPD